MQIPLRQNVARKFNVRITRLGDLTVSRTCHGPHRGSLTLLLYLLLSPQGPPHIRLTPRSHHHAARNQHLHFPKLARCEIVQLAAERHSKHDSQRRRRRRHPHPRPHNVPRRTQLRNHDRVEYAQRRHEHADQHNPDLKRRERGHGGPEIEQDAGEEGKGEHAARDAHMRDDEDCKQPAWKRGRVGDDEEVEGPFRGRAEFVFSKG